MFRSLRQSHFEGASVDITREQAADLLYKSQVERRLIQGGIFQSNDGATFGFLGRIERLDNRSLTIDARSWPHHLSGRAAQERPNSSSC